MEPMKSSLSSFNFPRLLFLLLICLLVLPYSTHASNYILQPSSGLNDGTDNGAAAVGKDCFIADNNPSANFNTEYLYSGVISASAANAGFPGNTAALIQFDLADSPLEAYQARIKFRNQVISNADAVGILGAYKALAGWSETAVNWISLPAYETSPSAEMPFSNQDEWVYLDITEAYNQWKSSGPYNGLVLRTNSSDAGACSEINQNCGPGKFFSSDAASSLQKPVLLVEGKGDSGDCGYTDNGLAGVWSVQGSGLIAEMEFGVLANVIELTKPDGNTAEIFISDFFLGCSGQIIAQMQWLPDDNSLVTMNYAGQMSGAANLTLSGEGYTTSLVDGSRSHISETIALGKN